MQGKVQIPGLSKGTANNTYLRLDTTNDPLTGTLAGDSLDFTGTGTFDTSLTVTAFGSAGFVKNDVAGLLSGGNTISVGDITDIATTYLKLDASNDPLTGDLTISKETPAFILDDTTAAQSWKMRINPGNGSILWDDVTAATNGVLTFEAGSPQYSLYFDSSGNVGQGRNNPTDSFHIYRASGTASIKIQTLGTTSRFILSSSVNQWSCSTDGSGGFIIKDDTTGEFPITLTTGVPKNSLRFTSTITIFNNNNYDRDFRIETVNQTNAFYVNAGTDRVSILTSSPLSSFDINGSFGALVETKTASFTAADAHTYRCDATSGAITVTLPAANTCTNRIYNINKKDSSSNIVTVTDGTFTAVIYITGNTVSPQSDGTEWFII